MFSFFTCLCKLCFDHSGGESPPWTLSPAQQLYRSSYILNHHMFKYMDQHIFNILIIIFSNIFQSSYINPHLVINFINHIFSYPPVQGWLKCWNSGTAFWAEQGPCEPSKGFVSKFGEQQRARESQREPEGATPHFNQPCCAGKQPNTSVM